MARTTTNHDEIRRWVSERGGFPARVKGTEKDGGLLRIDDPGFTGEERLQAITWTEFFKGFEKNNLAFLYEDETKSRFSKLVERKAKGN